MIDVGRQREPTYLCRECGWLTRGALGRHGQACPRCTGGGLVNVALVTRRMLERAEAAS